MPKKSSRTAVATLASALKKVDPDLYEELVRYAEERGLSIGEVLGAAVEMFLTRRTPTSDTRAELHKLVEEIDWSNINSDTVKVLLLLDELSMRRVLFHAEMMMRVAAAYSKFFGSVVRPSVEFIKELVELYVKTEEVGGHQEMQPYQPTPPQPVQQQESTTIQQESSKVEEQLVQQTVPPVPQQPPVYQEYSATPSEPAEVDIVREMLRQYIHQLMMWLISLMMNMMSNIFKSMKMPEGIPPPPEPPKIVMTGTGKPEVVPEGVEIVTEEEKQAIIEEEKKEEEHEEKQEEKVEIEIDKEVAETTAK